MPDLAGCVGVSLKNTEWGFANIAPFRMGVRMDEHRAASPIGDCRNATSVTRVRASSQSMLRKFFEVLRKMFLGDGSIPTKFSFKNGCLLRLCMLLQKVDVKKRAKKGARAATLNYQRSVLFLVFSVFSRFAECAVPRTVVPKTRYVGGSQRIDLGSRLSSLWRNLCADTLSSPYGFKQGESANRRCVKPWCHNEVWFPVKNNDTNTDLTSN